MRNNRNRFLLSFFGILLLWLLSSQEIYIFARALSHALLYRYIIYFAWFALTAVLGYFAFNKLGEHWVKKLWAIVYTIAFVILLLIGMLDLLVLHLRYTQKTYIQAFRLFFQSPAPLVIFYLLHKLVNNNIPTSTAE